MFGQSVSLAMLTVQMFLIFNYFYLFFYYISGNSPGILGELFGIYLDKFDKNLRITRDTIHFYKFIVYRCDANKFDKCK